LIRGDGSDFVVEETSRPFGDYSGMDWKMLAMLGLLAAAVFIQLSQDTARK
jgi:hypothetical protein